MATITASTTVGLYICEEENSQIAGNTPGGINLSNLTDGDTYVYCASVISFDHKLNFMDSEAFPGHKTHGAWAHGGTGDTTGGKETGIFLIALEMTEANAYNWKQFSIRNNRPLDASKFLIHQRAANTFEAFPSRSVVSKYYVEVIVLDIDVLEVGGKKDLKRVTLTLQQSQSA